MNNKEEQCPFQRILKYSPSTSQYYVKFKGRKYSDSEYLTEEQICQYPEGKQMLNRFNRSKNENSESKPYDPAFDKIDTILFQDGDRYQVLWGNLGFDELTWETQVDRKQLNLFQKREQYQFPNKSEDVSNPHESDLIIDDNCAIKPEDILVPSEMITFKKLVYCYNNQKDFLLRENMGIDALNPCITFLRILQSTHKEHGPYLIVSERKWYEKLREKPEMLSIYYGGNETSIEKINELYFRDDIETPHFHTLVVSPSYFEHYIAEISKINYRVAIFHSYKAQMIYKKYAMLKVGMSICINVHDPSQLSRQIDVLSRTILESKVLKSDEAARVEEINAKIQPSLTQKLKRGDPQFIAPPIISIDCPLSDIQKAICRSVLTEFSEKTHTAVEKVLRICSHAFLTFNGEYDLSSPNFVEASTKLQILDAILNRYSQVPFATLIISQYDQMIGYIIDLLDERHEIYDLLSTDFDEDFAQSLPNEPSVYLFNPKYADTISLKNLPPIDRICTVVIFDGGTSVWNEMLQTYRLSRTPLFNVSNVFHLECLGCCERKLFAISEYWQTIPKSKAEAILQTAAIHAYSDFAVPPIEELLANGIPEDKAESTPLIAKYVEQSDYKPNLNGEIIHGHPPPPITEVEDEENSYIWSVHERNLLTRGLFRIGLNRTESLQKVVGLYLPADEIERMIPPILYDLIKVSQSSGSNRFNNIKNYLKKSEEKYRDSLKKITDIPTFNDEDYLFLLRSHAAQLLKRLELLYYLDNSLGGDGKETDLKPDQVPQFRYGGINLAEWWNDQHDKALAYITWRFGLGCYDHYEEYADSNEFCDTIAHFQTFIEYKRLTNRSLSLCEAAKKISFTDQRIIYTLSKRPSKWPEEVQAKIIEYLLNFGVFEDENGNPDYNLLASRIQYPELDGNELSIYINEIKKIGEDPNSATDVPTSMFQQVLQRIDAMRELRKLLRDKKSFLNKIKNAQHWGSLRKKWTPDIELAYFERVERRGFSELSSIFKDSIFQNIFDVPPTFFKTEDEVVKRINVVAGKTSTAVKKVVNSPTSSFSPSPSNGRKTVSNSASSSSRKRSAASKPASGKQIVVAKLKELQKELRNGIKYPIQVTQVSQILDLGQIVTNRPGFHNERYIFPKGYKATRQFWDLKNPDEKVTWISEIVDTGKSGPVFRIYPEGRPNEKLEGETPSSPWVMALKEHSRIKGEKGKANTISGPDAYMLTHPITIYLIQHMEGADQCSRYVMKPIAGESNDNDDD